MCTIILFQNLQHMKNYRCIYCTEASIEGWKCVGGMKVWFHMFSDRIVNDSELCTSCPDYFIPTETVPGILWHESLC